MTTANVAIRLGTEGAADVRNDLASIGDAGDKAAERAARAFDRASADIEAATKRQAAAAAKLQAAGVAGATDASSLAATRAAAAELDAYNRRAEKIRDLLDPSRVALRQFNAAMEENQRLMAAGALSATEFAARETQLKTALDRANASLGSGAGLDARRAGMQQLGFQVGDVTAQLATGTSVITIFAQQSSQVIGALQLMAGEAKGFLGILAGPWGVVITSAVSIVALLASSLLSGSDAADDLKKHQQELGAIIDQTTGKINEQSKALLLNQAVASQKDAAEARRTADTARRNLLVQGTGFFNAETGDVINQDSRISAAIAAFKKSGDADKLAASMKAIGDQSPRMKSLTDQIIAQSAAFVTADRQAKQYEAQTRLLTGQGKPGDNRLALGQFGPEKPDLALADAEAKLAAATTKREKAEAQATITHLKATKAFNDGTITLDQYKAQVGAADAAVSAASKHTDAHAVSLARQAASMDVSAKAAFDVADAYLKSSAAGTIAEARRKALTDATRKGIDVDEQVRRQIALQVAEGAAGGAKAIATLRDETGARAAVNDNVAAGTLAIGLMNQALSDESTLRPLIALQTNAQGEALAKLTGLIAAYRKALGEAHTEEQRSAAMQATHGIDNNILALRDAAEFAGDRSVAARVELARRAAERDAADRFPGLDDTDPKRVAYVDDKVAETRTQISSDNVRYLADQRIAQKVALELTQAELGLVGKSADQREAILNRLKVEQELRNRNVDLSSAEAQAVLAGVDAQSNMVAKLHLATATIDEMRSFASDLLDPSDWKSWGDAADSVLGKLKSELLKLALMNPLQNWINGNSALPTLGGVIGKIGGLFGLGGGGISSPVVTGGIAPSMAVDYGALASLGHNAAGTASWSGGLTWINENGGEIADLPNGTRIYPAGETRRMLEASNDAAPIHYYDLRGAVVQEDLYRRMQALSDNAAARGAAGGAAIARKKAAQAVRRRMAG